MKTTNVLALAALSLLLVAMPAEAQTRKQKKEAKAAAWEAQQKRQQEEEELKHQLKMQELQAEQAIKNAERKRAAVGEMPCQVFDDDEWFYMTISRRFDAKHSNTAPRAALRSAQAAMREKLRSRYQSVLHDYFDQMDTENGQYEREHLESAGNLTIDRLINETYEICRKQTFEPDETGYYVMYMAIKISKNEFVEEVVKTIGNEEELRVRFNEKQFRDSAFKEFKQEKNDEYQEFVQ